MAYLLLRPATEADVPAMVGLRREAESWLAGRGIEQWTAQWTHVVGRGHAGRNIGGLLLDWATDQAARHGYPWLRLDVWPTNPGLMDYYRTRGFSHVRTERVPGRDTGALFQRPAATTPFPGLTLA